MAQRRSGEFQTGHKKVGPLETVVPAPSGGNFIPSGERGPRPELPHKEDEGAYGDYRPIKLSDTQTAENAHIKKQQNNWDAHHDLEQAAKAAPARSEATGSPNFKDEDLEPEARERLSRDAAAESAGTPASTTFVGLKSLHSELSNHLETLRPHLAQQDLVAREAQRAATDSYQKGQDLELSHRAAINRGEVPPAEEVEEKVNHQAIASNLASFRAKHYKAMNRHATAESLLTKAKSLMERGSTADATDLMVKAHGEISSMVKHLNSPSTKFAYEKANVYAPTPQLDALRPSKNALAQNIATEGGGFGRKRGPQGDAPSIKIGKPGRLRGDKGSLETVTADEAGVQRMKEKYGTQHPYYKQVNAAHITWKQGKTGNKSINQILLAPKDTAEKRDNTAILDSLRTPSPNFPTPEAQKAEFVRHAGIVNDAVKNGHPIPGASADHIGIENVRKLMQRHFPKEN